MNQTLPNQTTYPNLQDNIYESLPALEAYLENIRARREQRKIHRIERERLQAAMQLLHAERQAAVADDDAEIVAELDAALSEFQRRIDRLNLPVYSQAVVSAERIEAVPPEVSLPPQMIAEPAAPSAAVPKVEAVTELAPIVEAVAELPPPVLEIPAAIEYREPEPEQKLEPEPVKAPEPKKRTAQETQAILTRLRGEHTALEQRWRDIEAQGLALNGVLNRPACFRTRVLACELNRICAEADAEGLHDAIHADTQEVRARIKAARAYARDIEMCLPFQDACDFEADSPLSAYHWSDLATQYERAAVAQDALNWYVLQDTELVAGMAHPLLNAVGAGQQALFWALNYFRAGDRLQTELYGKLRESSGSIGFLDSLDSKTEWDALEQLCLELPERLRIAQQTVTSTLEKRAKDKRKAEAVQAVVEWSEECDRNDFSEDALARNRSALLPRLDACLAAAVPASNAQVRTALLDSAPRLLEGLAPYAKILEVVLAERKRKGLDELPTPPDDAPEVEEEDLSDAQIDACRELVRDLAAGQDIVIIGGSAKPQVAEKLKQILHCRDVEWIDSKKSSRMSKFKTAICNAHIIIAVKKFASHEMTEKSRDWAKEYNRDYVFLPSGYGVNQIINQMYLQLLNGESPEKTPAPKSANNKLDSAWAVCAR